jgi:hypothetical protein
MLGTLGTRQGIALASLRPEPLFAAGEATAAVLAAQAGK